MSIATVVSITGQAWARDAQGNLRELRLGDQLQEGETLVTSDNGTVELDFLDGLPPVAIGGGQQVAMSGELDASVPVDNDEASADDEGIETLLTALEGDDDLFDSLESPAAGGGGGIGGGGHSFVQLARIMESVDPLEFDFDTARDPVTSIELEGDEATVDDGDSLDTSAEISVTLGDINSANASSALISGTTSGVEAGQVVSLVISDDDATSADVAVTATVQPDGSYEITADLSDLDDGSLTVTATVEDQAGNEAIATDTANLDTTIGDGDTTIGDGDTTNGAAVTIDGISDDTGTSRSDFVTNDTSLELSGRVELADGDSLTVRFNGTDYTTANGLVIADGSWTLDLTDTELAEGTYPVSAVVSDAAGNAATATQDVVIDTTIGDGDTTNGAAVTIDGISDDTGTSRSDFVTNDTSLELSGRVELADGDSLTVRFNGTDYTTANGLTLDATAGTWSLDLTDTELAEGTYPVSAVVSDAAGNAATATQDVVIDTTIGDGDTTNGAAVTIDGISDDTGTSRSDFVTNDTSLVLSGRVELADGDSLTVRFNGTDYTTANGLTLDATAGTWSLDLTDTELAEGSYPVSAVVSDAAGNAATATQDVVIDTTIGDGDTTNGAAVTIDGISDDTGTSRSDFVTNDTSLVLSGRVELADGDSLTVRFNGTDYTTANGLTLDATAGTWSLDLTDTELAEGSYPVSAVVSDAAGNAATATQDVVIDTTIGDGDTTNGAAVTIDGISDDTGTSRSDFVTNDTSLVLSGRVELADGDSLTVRFNGTDYTTANGLTLDATAGTWSLDLTDTELAEGSYPVSAVVSDAAGNAATATQDVVIDTTIGDGDTTNGAAVTIDGISDDTGTSRSDFVTNDTSLELSGRVELADGDSLTVRFNGTDYTTANGLTLDATAGTWSLDLTDTELAEGSYPVSAVVSDAAGNAATATQDVVIDTTIGDGDTTNGAAVTIDGISDDTGTSRSDFVTNDTSLELSGRVELADGDSLTVRFNGTDYTTANGLVIADGSWTLDLTDTELAEGTYPVSAVVSDAAGNAATATQDVVIDTTIGDGDTTNGAAVTIDGISDDTGTSRSDFVTNDTSLVLSGRVELADGDSLTVRFNGTDYTTANGLTLDATAGTWSLDLTDTELAEGSYPVSAVVSDAAGNAATATQDVVIDTTAPGGGSGGGEGNAIAFDDAVIDASEQGSVTFSGTVEDGATIDSLVISDSNATTADLSVAASDITVGDDGTVSVVGQDLSDLADGELTVTMTVTDAAGNTGRVDNSATLDTSELEITNLSDSGDVTVYESFLDDGTRVGDGSVVGKSWFGISATAGIQTLAITGTLRSGAGEQTGETVSLSLSQLEGITSSTPVEINTDQGGILRLTGFDASTGKVDYEFELSQAVTHQEGGDARNLLVQSGIDITVTDVADNVEAEAINVVIVDDAPVVEEFQDALLSVEVGTILSGSLGIQLGSDTETASVEDISLSTNDDGQILAQYSDPVSGALMTAPVTVESGQTLTYAVQDGVLTATTSDGEAAFQITVDPGSGSYTLEVFKEIDPAAQVFTGFSLSTGGNNASPTFGDDSLQVTVSAGDLSPNWSAKSIWVAQGGKITTGQTLRFDFHEPGESTLSNPLSKIVFTTNGASSWEAYLDGELVHSDESAEGVLTILAEDVGSYFDRIDFIGTSDGYSVSNNLQGLYLDSSTDFALAGEVTVKDGDGDSVTVEGDFSFSADSNFEGGPGDEILVGTTDNDVLMGGEGNDQLIGREGSDTLFGGLGADVFVWQLGDEGQPGDSAHDTVKDFSLAEGDSLNLTELLVDETTDSIDDYLHAEPSATGDDTILHVSTTGGFGGDFSNNSGQEDQTITLEGVSMDGQSSQAFINDLIQNGNLNIDQ
ncbi:retention module-containing protein [Halomonas sp. YLGW01]|uniref:retention module-containing protein n=1 Tax=Halomonas sp. YLGW01 TaxID=2773308 RepID=UPI001786349B|nr:retention module-containing protein [Halomonas sp. YLGW01]